jgi:hypothetical protein
MLHKSYTPSDLAEDVSANVEPAPPAHNVMIVAIVHDCLWKVPHSKTLNSFT